MSDLLSFEITEPFDFLMGFLVCSFGLLVFLVIYYLVRSCKRSKGRQPMRQQQKSKNDDTSEELLRNMVVSNKFRVQDNTDLPTPPPQKQASNAVTGKNEVKGDIKENNVLQDIVQLDADTEEEGELGEQEQGTTRTEACFHPTIFSPFKNAVLHKNNMHPTRYFSSEGIQGGVGGHIIPRQMYGYAPIHVQVPRERAVPVSSLPRSWL